MSVRKYYKILRRVNGEAEQIQRWLDGAFAKTALRRAYVLQRRKDFTVRAEYFEEIRFECLSGRFVLSGKTVECLVNIYILVEKKEHGEACLVSIVHDLPHGSDAAFNIEELVRQHHFSQNTNALERRPHGPKEFRSYWDKLLSQELFPQEEWFKFEGTSR